MAQLTASWKERLLQNPWMPFIALLAVACERSRVLPPLPCPTDVACVPSHREQSQGGALKAQPNHCQPNCFRRDHGPFSHHVAAPHCFSLSDSPSKQPIQPDHGTLEPGFHSHPQCNPRLQQSRHPQISIPLLRTRKQKWCKAIEQKSQGESTRRGACLRWPLLPCTCQLTSDVPFPRFPPKLF